MSDKTALGDRMKRYEQLNSPVALPRVPLLARIDGRAFHTFTRGLARPYDVVLSRLMVETTKYLVGEFDAKIGYTQSDEISLLWQQENERSELPFGGRVQKLASVVASATSAFFNRLMVQDSFYLPLCGKPLPMFDCRVWSVPNEDEGANYFLWRERDATKNSISMAAQSMFSHTALQNKNGTEQMEMLFQAGTNWNHYPAFFKRGTYVRREVVKRPLTAAERAKLPAKHAVTLDPTLEVIRNHVVALDMPPIGQLLNKKDFLFRSIEPLKYPQDESLAELAC